METPKRSTKYALDEHTVRIDSIKRKITAFRWENTNPTRLLRKFFRKNIVKFMGDETHGTALITHSRRLQESYILDYSPDGLALLAVRHASALTLINYGALAAQRPHVLSAVYNATNGTVLTLYHQGKWMAGTTNGVDVLGYKWVGARTYREIIESIDPKLWDKLDTDYYYTVVLSHPDHHPTSEPELVYISTCDAKTHRFVDVGIAGVKSQQVAPRQSCKEMINCCRRAYNKYVTTGEAFYGYILVNNATGERLFLQSTLMCAINRVFYEPIKCAPEQRERAIELRAIFTPTFYQPYLVLSTRNHNIVEQVEKVIQRCLDAAAEQNAPSWNENCPIDRVAAAIFGSIAKINTIDPNGHALAYDILMSPGHIEHFAAEFL